MAKTKKYIMVAVIAAITALFTASTAFGMGKVTLTVKNPNPYEGNLSWFVYEKEAGTTIKDIASLKNFTGHPVNVDIYAVDATSSESGSFILTLREDDQYSIGAWTKLDTETITMEPYEIIDIPFTITLPEGTPPGQYIGGIVVETGNNEEHTAAEANPGNTNGTSISVKTRIGSRVYLTIPGELVEDITVTDFSASKGFTGTTKFQFTIENNGNTNIEPYAHIDVYTHTGRLYETIDESLGTSSPNTIIKPTVRMEKRPLAGYFTAKARVDFHHKFLPSNVLHGAAQYVKEEISFWVIPWEIIFAILFVIFVILIIITNKKLARKRYFANSEQYTVGSCGDLSSIGKDRNVSWKKIARYNNLKPPYCVKPGEKIIVPKKKK